MDAQDASTEVLFKLWPWLEANRTRLIYGGAAVVVVAVIYSFVAWQRGQTEISAGEAFTQLVMAQTAGLSAQQQADAFSQLASKYSQTQSGQRAQLQAAAILYEAGSYADAQVQFQKYLDSWSGPYTTTAQLGIASCLEAQSKLDEAISAYQKVAYAHSSTITYLQAEYSLGRLFEQQGKLAEAESYYENAAQSSRAGGTLAEDAQNRAYQIKAKLSATQKSPTDTLLK